MNSVMLEVDSARLSQVSQCAGVVSVSPLYDYELDVNEVVEYVGSYAVQLAGYTGKGVRVAVLDSGIDYTHEALGGSGDPAEFAANDPTVIEAGTFPTAKVRGGYDFVGESWPNTTPEAPDPDPLDKGSGSGHGTHVADIIGGVTGNGQAPDVSLYAVKVCSSVSTSCSGAALMSGMDWAVDPNGDGRIDDHVDIVNMSLGSPYGNAYADDLAMAVNYANAAGTLTVASAGNSGDKPYANGTPGSAPLALSVAQTEVPSAFLQILEILTPASIAGDIGAVFQSWSAPLSSVLTGPLQYGNGAGGNLNGCSAFPAGSLTGKIVLVDRGVCAFSIKIANVAAGGGLAGVIGLVAPGDPFVGGYGGGDAAVPGYMISQADSNKIKSALAAGVTASLDPNNVQSLVKHVVGSSSRGPSGFGNYSKPEIGAPGASVSALNGSGSAYGPFGGTSGAAPVVTGSAALLKQKYPYLNPRELKALLVNTAETDIMNKSMLMGGFIAPISRIGGGEVRVENAANSPAFVWTRTVGDMMSHQPVLSFYFNDVTGTYNSYKNVVIQNMTNQPITYQLTPSFRYADDEATEAVTVNVLPSVITVPAAGWGSGQATFQVQISVDGSKLREWELNSGPAGANGDLLTKMEYDGYIWLDNLDDPNDDGSTSMLHVPWHILPRQAGDVASDAGEITLADGMGAANLTNSGAGMGYIDAFSWIATSDELLQPDPGANAWVTDLKDVGVATYPVPAGYCSANPSFILAFALNTWNRQAHANAPGNFEIDLDTDQDGDVDYFILNWDASGYPNLTDGRNLAFVYKVGGSRTAFFYTNNGMNSGNTVLYLCGEQIGMNAANFHAMDVIVFGLDLYYSGNVTDYIDGLTVTPFGDRFVGVVNDIAPGATETLTVYDTGATGNNTEMGVLLFLDGDRGAVRGGAPAGNEALTIKVNP
jgi:subtilisin family serine protease